MSVAGMETPESFTVISRAPLTIAGEKYRFGDVLDGDMLRRLWPDRVITLNLMIGTIEVTGVRPDPRLMDPTSVYSSRPLQAVPDRGEAESRAAHPTAAVATSPRDDVPAPRRDVIAEVDLALDDDEPTEEMFDPAAVTAVEVEAWVDEHPDELDAVIRLEESGKNRTVLLRSLRRRQAERG